MLRGFSRLLDALNGISASLDELTVVQQMAGPATDRLEALELHRAQFEAEMKGLLLEADGKRKAAANAEARERKMKESYESEAFDPDGQESAEARRLLPDDAPGGKTEGLPPVRVALATNDKTHAVNSKWWGTRR